jgi:hypothetical protein
MKLLVGAGLSQDGYTSDVEILDLVESKNRCWNLQNFPLKSERLIGTLFGSEGSEFPLLCGMSN